MTENWTYREEDRIVAEDLAGFLPDRIFDSHAHLYDTSLSTEDFRDGIFGQGPACVTLSEWQRRLSRQVGSARLEGGLFFPIPTLAIEDPAAANAFLVEQIEGFPKSRGLILVTPQTSEAEIDRLLSNPQVVGLKPYHVFGPGKHTFDSPITDFLPERVWRIADRHGSIVTLHIVRSKALADPRNQQEIHVLCTKYPNVRLVLAHAGRGFHGYNTQRGLEALSELENVWFDSAAVCEATALAAVLREFGPRRLLWGSDFPVSEIRGKCVTLGDGFAWLEWDTVSWNSPQVYGRPILVGLESLMALREATEDACLNREDVQDIFRGNALRLLGMEESQKSETADLYAKAKQRIPGGVQLLSKRPEQFAPDRWPAYFRESRGCEVWDLDGKHYYDFSLSGISACLLGFRDPDVTRAVQRRVMLGSMSTQNPPEEVWLADRLCEIHPWAERVRFTRTGGEACAVAVRIARATTDRSVVAVCGYHGWHDWYMAANLGEADALAGHLLPGLDPAGVPRELRGTTLTFRYNNREDFQAVLDRTGNRLAAVIMEPCRYHDPDPGFLEFVREGAHSQGALLLFDEITLGWRLAYGGAHLRFGVNPDIAVLGKALGNGHPIGTAIGTAEAMEGAHRSFISSTYWTESVGPAAALATLEKMSRVDVPARVAEAGEKVRSIWRDSAASHDVPVVVEPGYACLPRFRFDHPEHAVLRTLYTQHMLEEGFLAGISFSPTLAHSEEVICRFAHAANRVFARIRSAIETGDIRKHLKGDVAHSGFARLL
jgi:glutamate-1-semialdehyde 2,1-aminomutase